MLNGENPPVGLILCAEKDHAVARYALEGLPNKVMAANYRTALPDEKTLAEQVRHRHRHHRLFVFISMIGVHARCVPTRPWSIYSAQPPRAPASS